jgi:hypothetical protein
MKVLKALGVLLCCVVLIVAGQKKQQALQEASRLAPHGGQPLQPVWQFAPPVGPDTTPFYQQMMETDRRITEENLRQIRESLEATRAGCQEIHDAFGHFRP